MSNLISRRQAIQFLAAGAAAAAWPVRAQSNWPNRPITIVVPYTAGGFTDQMARLVQAGLSKSLGQTVVIDNRPGANSLIGVDAVAKAKPDGYTFGVVIAAYAANPSLYDKLPYAPQDLVGVSLMGVSPLLAAISNDAPFGTTQELIDYAKANPGKVSFGSSGNGSAAHLTSELFTTLTGTDMIHAPYRGAAPALADLMGGHLDLLFDAPTNLVEQGKQGRVRLIGVASEQRLPAAPDVPTFIEQGIEGFVGSTWASMIAPAGVPTDILERVSSELATIVRSDEIRARLDAMGTFAEGSTPEECDAFIAAETAKWGEVIRNAGLKAE